MHAHNLCSVHYWMVLLILLEYIFSPKFPMVFIAIVACTKCIATQTHHCHHLHMNIQPLKFHTNATGILIHRLGSWCHFVYDLKFVYAWPSIPTWPCIGISLYSSTCKCQNNAPGAKQPPNISTFSLRVLRLWLCTCTEFALQCFGTLPAAAHHFVAHSDQK